MQDKNVQPKKEGVQKYFYDPIKKVCYEPFNLHWEHKYKRRFSEHALKVLALDLVLLTVIAGLLTFGFFADQILPAKPAPTLVKLDLTAASTAKSGEPADYLLTYRNESPQTLGCVQMKVHLPPDTVVEGPLPAFNGDDTACAVDGSLMGELAASETRHDVLVFPQTDLEPGESRTVTIRATTYGPTGTAKAARAELSYWEESATSATRVALRREWPIDGSVLALGVDSPAGIARGRTHAVKVSYKNEGARTLKNAVLRVSSPDDFTVTGTEPAPAAKGEWRMGDLASGKGGTITLFGFFKSSQSASGDAPTFTAEGLAEVAGAQTVVEAIRYNADARASELQFTLETEPAGREAMLPGETLRAVLRYRNDGTHTLKGLRVRLDPGGPYVEMSGSGPFTWDAGSDPTLAELPPGAQGTLVASIVVPTRIARDTVGAEAFPELYLSANAEYLVADDLTPVRADTATVHMPIAAHMELGAVAAYYTAEGDQLGTGPLPPKVGATTKYRVILFPSVTSSDAQELVVTAHLPEGVEWTGRTSVSAGGALDFLPSTRTVRWKVDSIPAWTGLEGAAVNASFEVAVTPSADDKGKAMPIVMQLEAHAKDSVTGMALHATTPDLMTDRTGDPRTAGKGNVAP